MQFVSAYDALASSFDRDRVLPEGIAPAIRRTALDCVAAARPRLLDLGAGTGRTGWPFVMAGDDYVGVDLSFGMLRAFAQRAAGARLVQADGQRLPFGDAAFDAVMLVQVFGGIDDWSGLVSEVRRVLRGPGAILTGRTAAPDDGIDARMKRRLASILGANRTRPNVRADVERLLGESATRTERRIAGTWTAERTPRQFIARHRGGARFSALPERVKDDAMTRLAAWAETTFGSLDAPSSETHAFEWQVFRFEGAAN
jgi:ubiquinone/menaquinone biosynthesis C-methylase UbiE